MSKPVLYVFEGSVWSAGEYVAELFSKGDIEFKRLDLLKGENFAPSFVSKNPNGTIPTLEADGQIYTSTAEVISYFVKKSSKNVKPRGADSELIEVLHADKYDPNFALLLSRHDEEMNSKSGLATAYLGGRKSAALNEYSTLPEAEPHKSFYDKKIASNGAFLDLYQGTATEAKSVFFAQSQAHFNNIQAFFNGSLASYLPHSGFLGGETPGEDDYHLCAWITRIAASLGAKQKDDAIPTLENAFESSVPPKVSAYWQAWIRRPSFTTVYPELH
ncbi:hypothetical protein BDP27DRAFT_1224845 [Rhodocollybia butyracea]|uniref:GST N-terminal domain-containing protein n=1 Tax=Rhodocollybia butyracea TaxID=206335 RepID=A0A9P5PQ90_9AGAR|nr:hypothetical protein BDP27DRAFT_1224845 [Rhodocollybia butyracea]